MKIKTSELTDAALDWAAAVAAGHNPRFQPYFVTLDVIRVHSDWDTATQWTPSNDYSQGGPIMDQEGINSYRAMEGANETGWFAYTFGRRGTELMFNGPTRLIAGMRCVVALRLGDEVDVPDELLPDELRKQQASHDQAGAASPAPAQADGAGPEQAHAVDRPRQRAGG